MSDLPSVPPQGSDGTTPSSGQRGFTPLGIIALFVSLAQVTLTVGVLGTTGTIQLMLALFFMAFPTYVFYRFHGILWDRPHHFYSPREYSTPVGVQEYSAVFARRSLPIEAKPVEPTDAVTEDVGWVGVVASYYIMAFTGPALRQAGGIYRSDVTLWITGFDEAILEGIEKVTYYLPPHYPNPVRTVKNRDQYFEIVTHGAGDFGVVAEVYTRDEAGPVIINRYVRTPPPWLGELT